EQPNLPALPDPGIDACTQVPISGQRRQIRLVLEALTDVLVRHLLGQCAPAKILRVARGDPELILRQTRELVAVDCAADWLIVDVVVRAAALVVLIVSIFADAVDRDLE